MPAPTVFAPLFGHGCVMRWFGSGLLGVTIRTGLGVLTTGLEYHLTCLQPCNRRHDCPDLDEVLILLWERHREADYRTVLFVKDDLCRVNPFFKHFDMRQVLRYRLE